MTSKKEDLLSWLYEDYMILRFAFTCWLMALSVFVIILLHENGNLKVLHEVEVQQETLQ